ncbi:hypothetical protein L1987_20536 [Smallanthus sonchifolius]|uniref:Uncharacterized protein n=1 Tax=Smallanthus sonchifolius TaxID=185202 RepID=A0ACB9ITA0_9ASTR|nr:hypothetical protein L1987_20536 [Smallanthus sonchifolius]
MKRARTHESFGLDDILGFQSCKYKAVGSLGEASDSNDNNISLSLNQGNNDKVDPMSIPAYTHISDLTVSSSSLADGNGGERGWAKPYRRSRNHRYDCSGELGWCRSSKFQVLDKSQKNLM